MNKKRRENKTEQNQLKKPLIKKKEKDSIEIIESIQWGHEGE